MTKPGFAPTYGLQLTSAEIGLISSYVSKLVLAVPLDDDVPVQLQSFMDKIADAYEHALDHEDAYLQADTGEAHGIGARIADDHYVLNGLAAS